MAENPTSESDLNKSNRTILLQSPEKKGMVWLDITEPDEADIQYLTETYNLHPLTLQDCLQPDHLPKFEQTDPHCAFVIIRVYDTKCVSDPDTLQALSNKIALFIGPDYIISIHRSHFAFLEEVAHQLEEWSLGSKKQWSVAQVLGRVLREAGASYLIPVQKIESEIDYFESRIFLRSKIKDLLRSLYLLKRKISLLRRLVLLSREPVVQSKVLFGGKHSQLFQDVSDRQLELEIIYDQLFDNMNQLMNLYISLSSQRTNEVMRILTIFSVFFLPLTFIVGVYGMNFRVLPELEWRYGYAFVWGFMLLVTGGVFVWFRKRGWL